MSERRPKEARLLILSRKVGETLVIGGEIEVTVLGSKGNQVRLGIKAPKEVSVHREEVQNKVRAESEE
tara:strand:- start:44 stop:247 length:204 start_codon:yes stop_codon:yes gene_type:complete